MLKKLKIILTIIYMLTGANALAALPNPLLVIDARNTDNLPPKFRMATDLHAAGSAQFSERGLVKALTHLRTHHVTIVDLRQESHGFLNGNAISWYGKHDAANAGLTPQEIDQRETGLLNNLAKNKFATLYKIINKTADGSITIAKPQDYAVHGTSSEQEIAGKHHVKYKRIYVQDFHAPDNNAVDQFIKLARKLPHDHWLYFHCRGGSGRTTSFMAMYDMMRNAKVTSFDDIMLRQYRLGGKDLTKLPNEDEYKYPFALERLNFLKKFYDYAKESEVEFNVSWSDWLKAQV
jgi:protein-tyrosine phosphatase